MLTLSALPECKEKKKKVNLRSCFGGKKKSFLLAYNLLHFESVPPNTLEKSCGGFKVQSNIHYRELQLKARKMKHIGK